MKKTTLAWMLLVTIISGSTSCGDLQQNEETKGSKSHDKQEGHGHEQGSDTHAL